MTLFPNCEKEVLKSPEKQHTELSRLHILKWKTAVLKPHNTCEYSNHNCNHPETAYQPNAYALSI